MSRSSDCIILLNFLNASGQQSLRKMQEQTGIPFATIREYINPNVLTRKSWQDIQAMKGKPFYDYYITTIENPDSSGCQINISKFPYLEHYGRKYGFFVYYSKDKSKVFVEKLSEEDQWKLI